MKRGIVALAFALVLGACGQKDEAAPPAPAPSAFVSDDHGDGAAVFLRGRADGDKLLVDVVARGAPDVHGAALRIVFDPLQLAFESAQSGGLWSNKAIGVSKEGTPGQLAVAWTEKGEIGVEAKAEAILGTITFNVRMKGGSTIAFRPERCTLVDRHGAVLPVAWRGGTIPAR